MRADSLALFEHMFYTQSMPAIAPRYDDIESQLVRRAELLDEWTALEAQIAGLEARKAEVLAQRLDLMVQERQSAPGSGEMPFRSMLAEYSAAGHLPQRTVEARITESWALVRLYPATLNALAAGRISRRHADVILAEAPTITGQADADEVRAEYESRVLPFAEADTAARTRVHARGVTAVLCPATLIEQHRRARGERAVMVKPDGEGMAVLTAILPELLAYAVQDRLTSIARNVTAARKMNEAPRCESAEAGSSDPASEPDFPPADAVWSDGDPLGDMGPENDERSMDQLRADIFTDLLLTSDPETVTETAHEAIRATVHVTVSASTLAGLDERLGEFEGHGPLLPETARLLAGGATSWDRLFLDPTGLAVATDNYVPTSAMKRFLRARDQHCRFPGCRAPAHRCEIDHNHDHARGGPTALCNLSLFCKGHHSLKHPDLDHEDRWSARQLRGGVILWTSPLGRTYSDEPPLRVMFI